MGSELNQIERSTFIRAPRSRVWRVITALGEFCRWFQCETPAAAFEPGTPMPMTSTYPGEHYGAKFSLTVAEMTPEHTFRWRWHPGAPMAGEDLSHESETLVTFSLEEVEGGTRVTLTETGFDQLFASRRKRAFEDNNEGWRIQLEALDRYASDAS